MNALLGEMLLFVVWNLAEYLILLLLMKYVCSATINLNPKNVLTCCGMTIIIFVIAHAIGSFTVEFLCLPVAIALAVILYSSNKWKDLLRFFPALSIYLILTMMPQSILEELAPTWQNRFVIWNAPVAVFSLLSDTILLILLMILRTILIRYDTIVPFTKKEVIGSFALLFFCMIDVLLLMTLNHSKLDPLIYYIWLAIFIGFFFLSVGYYFYNLVETRVRFYRQTLTKNETEFLQLQLDALQDVKDNEEQVKRMRHDLKNHLEVIHSLCEEGNWEELKKYTKQWNNDTSLSENRILTGNKIADIIIRSKSKIAQEQGIRFTFSGSLVTLEKIDAPDICGLLANAYDNAIEACAGVPGAYIHTEAQYTRNYIVIYISNSAPKKVNIRNNNIATTKKDKHTHGYGTSIMKRIARKYNGNCTFHYAKETFRVKIVLLT
ncbi:MAG: GHKL domain-containing protein [Lachnospiraceae bacterium]|nr:GHKL domain-containing protein [Lachnospiraceae bacterium]